MINEKPMQGNRSFSIHDLSALDAWAERFVKSLKAPVWIALTGTLGAGKTTLGQLIAKHLGVTDSVSSPTFALLNEYASPQATVIHGDLYRLTDAELETGLLDLEDYLLRSKAIILLEWADKMPDWNNYFTWHIHLTSVLDDDDQRELVLSGKDTAALEALN